MLSIRRMRELLKLAGYSKVTTHSREELLGMVQTYLNKYKYAPRYLRGLTSEEKLEKKFDIRYHILKERSTKIPSYEPVSTDKNRETKVSTYTKKWYAQFPNAHSLKDKSTASGVPLDILQQVDRKGRAAWRGGQHRPGAGQAQWGIARVNSFLTCGKTFYTADQTLAVEASRRSPKARRHFQKCK